ncbi:flavodoxin family protein [Allosalinactinospora lopnorensis]|uniref:flavodoxin family protein n=1 Tax=Allosalinactinospora lopnorensis TaxID=1352348 RepID=UPI00191C39AF|nr:flavodoxin family protein [Allosalinactinospora lopnorensis]
MRALVVYESMFGNAETVAEEIAAGVATRLGVDVAEVSSAPRSLGGDVGLLIVGGPTHAFGMTRARPGSRPRSRRAGNRYRPGREYASGWTP